MFRKQYLRLGKQEGFAMCSDKKGQQIDNRKQNNENIVQINMANFILFHLQTQYFQKIGKYVLLLTWHLHILRNMFYKIVNDIWNLGSQLQNTYFPQRLFDCGTQKCSKIPVTFLTPQNYENCLRISESQECVRKLYKSRNNVKSFKIKLVFHVSQTKVFQFLSRLTLVKQIPAGTIIQICKTINLGNTKARIIYTFKNFHNYPSMESKKFAQHVRI